MCETGVSIVTHTHRRHACHTHITHITHHTPTSYISRITHPHHTQPHHTHTTPTPHPHHTHTTPKHPTHVHVTQQLHLQVPTLWSQLHCKYRAARHLTLYLSKNSRDLLVIVYFSYALATPTPGCLEHDGVAYGLTAGEGLFYRVDTCLVVHVGGDVICVTQGGGWGGEGERWGRWEKWEAARVWGE